MYSEGDVGFGLDCKARAAKRFERDQAKVRAKPKSSRALRFRPTISFTRLDSLFLPFPTNRLKSRKEPSLLSLSTEISEGHMNQRRQR